MKRGPIRARRKSRPHFHYSELPRTAYLKVSNSGVSAAPFSHDLCRQPSSRRTLQLRFSPFLHDAKQVGLRIADPHQPDFAIGEIRNHVGLLLNPRVSLLEHGMISLDV